MQEVYTLSENRPSDDYHTEHFEGIVRQTKNRISEFEEKLNKNLQDISNELYLVKRRSNEQSSSLDCRSDGSKYIKIDELLPLIQEHSQQIQALKDEVYNFRNLIQEISNSNASSHTSLSNHDRPNSGSKQPRKVVKRTPVRKAETNQSSSVGQHLIDRIRSFSAQDDNRNNHSESSPAVLSRDRRNTDVGTGKVASQEKEIGNQGRKQDTMRDMSAKQPEKITKRTWVRRPESNQSSFVQPNLFNRTRSFSSPVDNPDNDSEFSPAVLSTDRGNTHLETGRIPSGKSEIENQGEKQSQGRINPGFKGDDEARKTSRDEPKGFLEKLQYRISGGPNIDHENMGFDREDESNDEREEESKIVKWIKEKFKY